MTTYTTRNGRSVESNLTNDQAANICHDMRSDFAQSLASKARRGRRLSAEQIAWLHILANQQANPEPQPAAEQIDTAGIKRLFDNVGERLRYPKITLEDSEHNTVQLSKAGQRARVPGSINVTDGRPYRENRWFGRIVDGQFEPSRNCPDSVKQLIRELSADPAGIAAAYGHRTGNCCFCRHALTDERSTAVGYGPVCSEHYGLPWGSVGLTAREARRLPTSEMDPEMHDELIVADSDELVNA